MKIRDRIGRLARYFGRPATSVPPKIWPDGQSRGGEGGPAHGQSAIGDPPKLGPPTMHITPLPDLAGPVFAFPNHAAEPVKTGVFGHPTMVPTMDPMMDIHAEVARRLDALELPDDPAEAQRMVEAALADLPVRVGGVIRPGDDGYDDVVARHGLDQPQESQSHGFLNPDNTNWFEPNDMKWPDWQKWMTAINAPPGWSPCRFGARWGEDTVGQMFGVTRAEFGIYTKPFYICGPIHAEQTLAALIHLPTGSGVGLFMSTAMAVEAGELAMALGGIDWRGGIDPQNPDTWADIRERMFNAWTASGLHVAPFHAHDNSEVEIAIWMSTHHTRTAGKPSKEKLS